MVSPKKVHYADNVKVAQAVIKTRSYVTEVVRTCVTTESGILLQSVWLGTGGY
jgi:hypothetical protein